MRRREFLKSMTALAAGSALPAPAIWSAAKAQSRQETLLFVTESGPNNFDIHGVGTNRPGYEVSWNCYDRLMTHDKQTLADGTESYDRDKFAPELAEEWDDQLDLGHLQAAQERQIPRWHCDHRPGRQVVVRPRGQRRRLPHLPDEGRLAGEAGAIRGGGRPHIPRRLHSQGPADDSGSRRDRAVRSTTRSWSRSTPPRRTRGDWNTPSPISPAAAPTG